VTSHPPAPRLLSALCCLAVARGALGAAVRAAEPEPVRIEARVVGAAGAGQDQGTTPPGDSTGTPEDAVALIRRGNAARQAGRMREALAAYRRAAALSPRDYDVRILIADTLRRMGHDDEAMAEYGRAEEVDAAGAESWTGRALILRRRHDPAAAAALIETGLTRVAAGGRDALRVTLAETRRRQGRRDEAERLFREILATRADQAPARAGLAMIAEERGDLDAAISGWTAFLTLRPDDEAAVLRRRSLADLRAAIGALEATAGSGSAADQAAADRAAIQAEVGRLRRIAGDTRGAAAACRLALDLDPSSLAVRRRLALALRDFDRQAAASEFRRVLKTAPADGVALYNLVAFAAQGEDRAAERRAWRALLEARPRDLGAARAWVSRLRAAGPDAPGKEADRFEVRKEPARETGSDDGGAARRTVRAMLLEAAGRGGEAAGELIAALRADPTDPWTLDAAADLLAARPALLDQMAAAWRAAAGPGAADAVLGARILWWNGRTGEAYAAIRQAAAAHPDAPVTGAALAEAHKTIGRRGDLAFEERVRVAALPGARLSDQVDLALALLETGRAARAETVARRAIDMWPGAAPLLSVLGGALLSQGRMEEAAAAFAAAVEADPVDSFGLARGQYPLVLAALGRHLEARQALRGDIPPIPALVHEEAWKFARDLYRDRSFAAQDWGRWRAAGGAARTVEEAWRGIALMLDSLQDPYTRLREPEETEAAWLGPRGENVALDRVGRALPHSRSVVVEDRGGLGYIRLSNLTDPAIVEQVRAALVALREKEGIILDLRGNPGGLSRSADAIGDLIVGPGRKAGVDVGPDGAVEQVTGGDGAITGAPITVLVDEQTASAAERLARTVEESGRGTIEGTATYGKGLSQMSRVLPGGMTVLVSVAEMLGPDGRPIQGEGLKPRPRRAD
jgi:tetratricopeptide (TPR) repeat protein